jgi:purine-binding chemotaxis protein CheW
MDVLVFELDHNRYGVRTGDVVEIVRAVAYVPLPGAPRAIEGVFNLRGRLVPVLDVRSRFRLPERPLDPSQHFIIVRAGRRTVALRVDRAEALNAIDDAVIENPRDQVPSAHGLAGVANVPDGIILIHDPAAFLSQAESESLDEALSAITAEGSRR